MFSQSYLSRLVFTVTVLSLLFWGLTLPVIIKKELSCTWNDETWSFQRWSVSKPRKNGLFMHFWWISSATSQSDVMYTIYGPILCLRQLISDYVPCSLNREDWLAGSRDRCWQGSAVFQFFDPSSWVTVQFSVLWPQKVSVHTWMHYCLMRWGPQRY